jgi:hypothetical protein
MNKYIFIIFAIFLGLAVFPIQPVLAVDNLVVEFSCGNSTCPIFGAANFVPGGNATGWVRVTNNSGISKKIAIEAINKTDSDNLASKINLVIKEGGNVRYEKTLAEFFSGGEVYLSDLANGIQTRYDLIASFNVDAGDDYQGKTLGFDIIFGFQGEEGTGGGSSSGGGGGGGALPFGLTISNEVLVDTTETGATMTWTTSYPSTSYIIYGTATENHTLDLSDTTGTPPKYGYEQATPEIDITPKVISHTLAITGLLPGTTYFYRAVSHASLAISQEYTFTTLQTVQTKQQSQQQMVAGAATGSDGDNAATLQAGRVLGAQRDGELSTQTGIENSTATADQGNQTPNTPNIFIAGLASIALNIKNFFSSPIFVIILIIILILLVMWAINKFYLKKNRK